GRLQFSNRAFRELWGVSQRDLAENSSVEAIFEAAFVNVREGNAAEQMRMLIRSSTDGRTERSGRMELSDGRYLRFAAVPLPDGNALFTFIDVTDAERIETALRDRNEALEAADRAKTRFVENMSYELRTPLTAIAGFGELMAMGIGGELTDKQSEYVGSIMTSAERLRTMVNGIIDLAVSDVGGLDLADEEVDVSRLVQSVASMVEDNARDRGIDFELDVAPSVGELPGDAVRLKQALFNLASNAVRFTGESGEVILRATGNDAEVRFDIIDTGIGIPKDEHELVFERFKKGTNAGASQGVGLGLSLVKEIIDLHGGTIDVTSALNEGTEISVHLPRRAGAPVAAVAPTTNFS
ncbi:MAG: ATP-binding protein, partial [Pacificimonas sp.]